MTQGNILIADASNQPSWSNFTLASPSTSGNVLTSNGTNWTSATPAPSTANDYTKVFLYGGM